MVNKKTADGREYEVENGRHLVWHADVWEDEGEKPFDVRLPLRMKAGVLFELGLGSADALDYGQMRAVFEAIAPNMRDHVTEMDLLDFQKMFETWQHEYSLLNGVSLGES